MTGPDMSPSADARVPVERAFALVQANLQSDPDNYSLSDCGAACDDATGGLARLE
jgi:hypothetical protein